MDPQTPQTNPVPPPYEPHTPPRPEGSRPPEPMHFERPAKKGMHPMVVLQPGESIVATIRRHPFGILSLYAAVIGGVTIAAILAFILIPNVLDQFNTDGGGLLYTGLAGILVLLILILGVATTVYWQNEWIVTTDSITQVTQNSLFGRQVSQLSLDNLEDVTVNQDGILPHLFNFGILKVESAGERSKFIFPYCPNPNDYARKILEIHEQFLEERRNIQHR
jgi:hypothetical protein